MPNNYPPPLLAWSGDGRTVKRVISLTAVERLTGNSVVNPPVQNSIQDLQAMAAGEFIAYGDLNPPFCFALHERLLAWNLLDRIEWRLIVHAPELSSSMFSISSL